MNAPNRKARRAAEARAKMQKNADRVRNQVNELEEALGASEWIRKFLFAVAREHGRLRIRKEQLDLLHEDDRVDLKEQENGDVIIEFTSGRPAAG